MDCSDMENIIGKRYYLKTLLPEDVTDRYVNWLNDPEVNRYLEVRFTKSTFESTKEFVSSFDNESKYIFGIYSLDSNQHIGNIALYINSYHNTASYGYLIGEKEYWGKGAAIEAITLMLDFAFKKLNIRKVWGGAYLSNVYSIFNFKKLGFVQEGRLRQHNIDEGKLCDGLIFGILKEEWLSRAKV